MKVFKITLALSLIIALNSCNAPLPKKGIIKNLNTGITSTYNGIKLEKALLVMNGEEINHTDIPLGESFDLINTGIEGLQEKNNVVSIGCSLLIKDKEGNILLNADDLYKDNGIYKKDSARFLRCTISTGEPMKWEEKYDIKVVFWDKFGEGKIENNFTIRCIDIP